MTWTTTDIPAFIDSLPLDTTVEYRVDIHPLSAREQVRRGKVLFLNRNKYVGAKSVDGWRESVSHIPVVPSSPQPTFPPSTQPASTGPSDESPAEALSSGAPSMARLVTTIVTFTPPATKEE